MQWQPIIAGVDGSPESLRAAALAWRIARVADTRCVLVHAVPDVWVPGGLAPLANSSDVFQRLVAELQQLLDRELGAEIPASVLQSLIARPGRPGVVLAEVAREQGAELIVVGARHHGALDRGLGGSTAHQLVRTAPASVLVVGASSHTPRRVLIAADLFAAAAPTLATAGRYAELFGAQLRIVHVVEPAKFPTVVPLSVDDSVLEERARAEFERLLTLEQPHVPPENRVVRRGRADEAIAEEAAAWRADLLVVGSHGRGWIDRLLIGSTTERLLNRLPTSLLVVPISKPAARRTATKGSRRRKGVVVV
ncbi:MAG TPA: universal stress protein [Gemmatimonadales bacterium]|nr:universal stress protein [Gemmatimonadales bacterium]